MQDLHQTKMILKADSKGQAWVISHRADSRIAEALGLRVKVTRGGRVLPASRLKRLLFLVCRSIFGDSGFVAEWTRRWSGCWLLDLRPLQDFVEEYDSRDAAVAAEIELLRSLVGQSDAGWADSSSDGRR